MPFRGELRPPVNIRESPGGESAWRAWQAELETIIPRNDRASWLYLRYENTDAWAPANRFLLWQVRPLAQTNPATLEALKGASPRSSGHYCGGKGHCPEVGGAIVCGDPWYRWRGGHSTGSWRISQQQWDIYREIGQMADPWWVIQGTRGGHRKMLSDDEAQLLDAQQPGASQAWPKIGDLPYAAPDHRVWQWVKESDLLTRFDRKYLKGFDRRNWKDVERDEAEVRAQAGTAWGKWLHAQVDEMFDAGRSDWRKVADHYRAGAHTEIKDARRQAEARWDSQYHALLSGEG